MNKIAKKTAKKKTYTAKIFPITLYIKNSACIISLKQLLIKLYVLLPL